MKTSTGTEITWGMSLPLDRLHQKKNQVHWYILWVFFPVRPSEVEEFFSLNDLKGLIFCLEEDALPLCETTIFLYILGNKVQQRYFTESGNFIFLLCSAFWKLHQWVISLFYMASVTVEINCCRLSVLLFSIQDLLGLSWSDLGQGFS